MVKNHEAEVVKDLENKKITVTRQFDADVETVWDMWTKSERLDLWWAPKPWRAETKSMSFEPNGKWLYAMIGPKGERQWAMVEYKKIDRLKSFEVADSFSDDKGNKNTELPQTNWKVDFKKTTGGTTVTTIVSAKDKASLEKLLETGFEQGFVMALGNLDEYLQDHM
ncbi:MAG TPA: SRPBCC domain-containing protein [Cyclobacteriaceae bacterium]|nr:SRPBCC domain-containing protein [Cyclobacteriaceae bacterium]